MIFRHFLLVVSVILVACDPQVPDHSQFAIGMTRAEIRSEFGNPQRTQVLTKTGDQIWGPIEDYWPQVPQGATVEIWSYDSRMTFSDDDNEFEQPGQTQLYFINDSNEVSGIGFHIEGAVYEGS